MALKFSCSCGQKLKTGDELVGKRAKCPKCAQWLRVPQSSGYDTVAEMTEVKAAQAESRPATQGKARAKVVIADSVEEDIERLATILRQHGYDVVLARDGPQAVDLIRIERPDAAILDIKLDVLSGFQVVEYIHNPSNPKNDAVWTTPILMTTEKLRGRDKQYALSLGVKRFFAKPVMPASICARLEKDINRQAGLQQ
jgi:CheY-like chemotaxis protein